jgi:hypothetical protein
MFFVLYVCHSISMMKDSIGLFRNIIISVIGVRAEALGMDRSNERAEEKSREGEKKKEEKEAQNVLRLKEEELKEKERQDKERQERMDEKWKNRGKKNDSERDEGEIGEKEKEINLEEQVSYLFYLCIHVDMIMSRYGYFN